MCPGGVEELLCNATWMRIVLDIPSQQEEMRLLDDVGSSRGEGMNY